MSSHLKRRVERLESIANPTKEVPLTLFKYNMKIRRLPPEKRGINPNYVLSEPDLKSCREMGLYNIENIKSVRAARKEGYKIAKWIFYSV